MRVNPALRLHPASRSRNSQSGYVLIAVTIALLVLIGFAGLAIDSSNLEHVRRRMQTAADAGALSGAWELARGRTIAEIVAAAKADTSLNGFTDLSNSITVTVNNPPASGFYAGDPSAVEVIINQPNQQAYFMQVLGGANGIVGARAVAHLGSGNGCIFALNPTDRNSLVINGGADLDLGCGIIVDSSNANALNVNGCSGTVNATLVGVTGGVNDNCNIINSPPPITGLLPAPDPLASLPAPTVGPCNYTNLPTINTSITLNPGVYCGGISITGGTITFAPGTYIMNGGGLHVSGGAIVSGNDVTFYNTGDYSTYKAVSIAGTTTSNLNAPTSGTYQGILFFGCVLNGGVCDRSLAPKNSELDNSFGGTSGSTFNGVLYFPKSNVKYSGTPGSTASNLAIIADKIEISGTVNFSGSYSALPGGLANRVAVLGE